MSDDHKSDKNRPKMVEWPKEPWGLAEACIILAVVGATGLAYNIMDIWSNRSHPPFDFPRLNSEPKK